MDTDTAVMKLGALANQHRLKTFRLLIEAGSKGVAAGDLAARLGLTGPNMSFHLRLLEKAGLIRSSRDHRKIFYAIEIKGIRDLIAFLTDDCCGGRPELCGIPVLEGEKKYLRPSDGGLLSQRGSRE